jgi:hypothetical protein
MSWPVANGPRVIPHGNGKTARMSPHAAAGAPSPVPAGLPSARVIFDPGLIRHGAVDGGWWPRSRNALTELPGLIAALDARPGVRVQRLAVRRDEWDEIPHQLTSDGPAVRIDWFTTTPHHTVSVTTAGGREPIALLVVSPDTPAESAWDAMNIAATSPGISQATDILTAEEAPERPAPVSGFGPPFTVKP